MHATRILLVEDDEDDYILALDYLEELTFLNIEHVRVKNAEHALKKLKNEHFDLCLLDYQLGAVNGIEVLRQAKALGVSAPIIMLTGQADDALDNSALDAGAADYLIKSELNAARFARALRYALARRDVEIERVERLKAESENRSKSRFLAHLSHELRTPLTAILGYSELLLNDERYSSAEHELDIILRNGRHLLDLLNDVLDLSKIAANKLEINLAPTHVDSILADIYALLRVSASDKGLQMHLHSATPVPIEIITDAKRLRQILINLVNNAIKFTNEGRIDIRVSTQQVDQKEKLVFEICDTGTGIPKSKLKSIFQPFSQVADVISKSIGGSGLGLAISTELAHRLGGDISVKSKVNEGSCFTVIIDPGDTSASPRDRLSFESHDKFVKRDTAPQLAGRVLVVDDLRDIRGLISHMVQSSGAKVSCASNGLHAISAVDRAAASNAPFDLVLMDIHMPEMDGKQATSTIREHGHTLPIVALTAASMRGSREKLLGFGFNELLTKPIDPDALYGLLATHLVATPQLSMPLASATPLENTQTQPHPSSDAQKPTSADTGPLSVLLIEDDMDAAQALCDLLTNFNIQVSQANNLAQARQHITQQGWHAVLVDMHLPDGHGLDFITAMQDTFVEHNSFISIVSGETPDNDALAGLPIHNVLLKPIQLSALKHLADGIHRHHTPS